MNFNVQRLTQTGVMIALSVVGAMIKVPAITGTPALDSLPAFFAAVFLGPWYGAMTGVLGHLATALTAGFPLGPLHLLVAFEMGIVVLVFGRLHQWHKWGAFFVAFVMNGILSPLSFVPFLGYGFFTAMVVPLMVATGLNLGLAYVLIHGRQWVLKQNHA